MMGAFPSYGITMGYVSDPFRTEEQKSTRKGSLSQPMVKPWDAEANTLENQSWRVFETRRDPHKTVIPGARTVAFRRLTTTLSNGSWPTQAKDLRLPDQEVFAFARSIRFLREFP